MPGQPAIRGKPIKKTGAQGKVRARSRDFNGSSLVSRQHGQVLGQMRQGGVGVHMQGARDLLDMLRRQRAFNWSTLIGWPSPPPVQDDTRWPRPELLS